MKYRLILFIASLLASANIFAASPQVAGIKLQELNGSIPSPDAAFSDPQATIRALGWVKSCGNGSLCDGCYKESDNLVNYPQPKAFSDTPMKVTAAQPAFFTKEGTSLIQGDVKLIQPGREITADHVTFFRDNKTGKVNRSILVGHVNFRESGKLVVAEQGNLDFVNKIYILHRGVYRLLADTPTGLANVWGRAKHVVSSVAGVLQLRRATYSACPPDATSWYVWGKEIELDRNAGRGQVFNSVLFVKKIPILYLPYFNFPIDKQRGSGFLSPTPTYSHSSGYGLDFPYYFNLAPNYDATFSPQLFSRRGVLFNGLFRYLTTSSSGSFNVDYIPHDSAFVKFRSATLVNQSATTLSPYVAGALKLLKDSSDSRVLFSLQNDSHFGEHWRGLLRVNYTSDDYFPQDFSNLAAVVDNDQLLNRVDLNYSGEHWNFLGRLQLFQTLHPISRTETRDQYKRLPQLNLSGDFPEGWGGFDYRFDSELVNFLHSDDSYVQAPQPITNGVRVNLMPSVSLPLNWFSSYLTPRVQLQTTGYSIHDRINQDDHFSQNMLRVYPVMSIDSGVTFQRKINFFRKAYTQTLEPRIFYLVVPTIRQDHIPLFDTYLPSFDFNQLFRHNRFNGVDRVGDANQLTLAVTTKFLDEDGEEKFNAGLGQIVVIHKHQINIDQTQSAANFIPFNPDPLEHETLSPVVGKLQYFINSQVNTSLNLTWDPSYHKLRAMEANLQYISSPERVANFGYRYILDGDKDPVQNKPIDFSRIGLSVGWKIWQHWNIIGSVNYNVSYKRVQNYLYGVEYNSCCWSMRAMLGKNFINVNPLDNKSNYDSRIYIQFLLKGISDNLGSSGLEGVLANQVSGYRSKLVAGV